MSQATPPPFMMPQMAGSNNAGPPRFTPVDPLRVVKQYKYLLIAAAVVGMVLGVGVYFLLAAYAPTYRAKATVTVQPPMTNPYAPGETGTQRGDALEMYKLTQARFIYSERTLRNAVNQLANNESAWFAQFEGDKEQAYRELEESIRVNSVPDTQAIDIVGTAPTPTTAAELANAVVDQYIDTVEREARSRRGTTEALFNRRKDRLEDDISVLQRQLTDIMDQTQLSATEQSFNEVDQVYRDLIARQQELAAALSSTQEDFQRLKEQAADQSVEFSATEVAEIENHPIIRQINARLMSLREQHRVALERFGKDHRSVQDVEHRIDAAEIEKQSERQRLLEQLQEMRLSQAENSVASLESMIAGVEQQLTEIRERRRELNHKLATYDNIETNLEDKRDALNRLNETLSTMDILREHPSAPRIRLEMRAAEPQERASPQPKVVVPAITFLAVALVGGLVFLRELMDSRIKSPSCAKLLPECELVGCIPHASEDPSGSGSIDLAVARQPHGLLAENIRQIRIAIAGRLQRQRYRSLMVVGCQPGSGNSAVIANVVASFAYNGRRVLVVDANFRRPDQHRIFGLDEGTGLGDLLAGHGSLEHAPQQTEVQNLDVLTIGQDRGHILERLESDGFMNVMRQLEERYELVIVDAPPLSVVGDSRVLAHRVDAVLLTVRALQEKRGMVSRLVDQLREARAEFLGIVINGVRASAGGYFRRNYEAFYEYQNGGSERAQPQHRRRAARSEPAQTLDA
jgi:capsular exopolysaccharide synthesis family protein